MKNTLKNLTILMIGPILLSLTWHAKAQTPLTPVTKVDSLNIAQNTHNLKNQHPIFQKIERADPQHKNPNTLLLTPQRKKQINIRDLLLRPQDRNAIMIRTVQDTLAHPDSTKQEN